MIYANKELNVYKEETPTTENIANFLNEKLKTVTDKTGIDEVLYPVKSKQKHQQSIN